jgi:hypothetical protein
MALLDGPGRIQPRRVKFFGVPLKAHFSLRIHPFLFTPTETVRSEVLSPFVVDLFFGFGMGLTRSARRNRWLRLRHVQAHHGAIMINRRRLYLLERREKGFILKII